jgi:uncharacterized membrane protein
MRRPAPWIHRFSRPLIGLFAALGVADTAYLTSVKLGGGAAACSSQACNAVLSSPYANILGMPLSLFGLLAYLAMMVMSILPLVIDAKTNKKLHNQVQSLTWQGLFLGGTAMAVFSGYLMYLLVVVIKSPCPYCIASATFAAIIFVLVLIGREWEAIGSMITNGIIAGFLTLLMTFGLYSAAGVSITPEPPRAAEAGEPPTSPDILSIKPTTVPQQPYGWTISSQSGASEIALAEHLKKTGATMYGGWFCSHCYEQKQLFGREAFKGSIKYVECNAEGKNPQVELCQAQKIEGFPTWDIAGQNYPGVQPLEQLAKLSGYTGSMDFRYSKLMPGFSAKPAEASGKPESSPKSADPTADTAKKSK